jgi:hypothetical protein
MSGIVSDDCLLFVCSFFSSSFAVGHVQMVCCAGLLVGILLVSFDARPFHRGAGLLAA